MFNCNGYVFGSRLFFEEQRVCPSCGGSGSIIDNPCPHCKGIGLMRFVPEAAAKEVLLRVEKLKAQQEEFTRLTKDPCSGER